MNVTVKDINFLQSIQPEFVRIYLHKKGWIQQDNITNKATIWKRENEAGDWFQIVLPSDPESIGFPIAMSTILETLEKSEQRSQLDIFRDIFTQINQVDVQGIVIAINIHNSEELSGKINILGVFCDQLCQIEVELYDRNYILAIKAYQERLPILCQGDLVKEKNKLFFKQVQKFQLYQTLTNPESTMLETIKSD